MQNQIKPFQMFVGRESQFEEIAEAIKHTFERQVVLIHGDGGVGKTYLLKETQQRYHREQDILCFPVIDFYQIKARKFLWVLDLLATEAPNYFRSYHTAKQQSKAIGTSASVVSENDIIGAFYKDLAELEKKYRCVFLFDTIELIQETIVLDLMTLAAATQHSVFVMAGRRNAELFEQFSAQLGHKAVRLLKLSGFPLADAITYMQQIPAGEELSDDEQQKLYMLANEGVPVKLALALDWLSRGWALVSLTNYTFEELTRSRNTDGEMYQQALLAFERELVTQFGRLGSDIDRVIYTMAHVNKRFNRKLLQLLLPDISDQFILDKIGALPFVKVIENDFYVLHDEVQRIIVQRIWGQSDPTAEMRHEISKTVVQYYNTVLADLQSHLEVNSNVEADVWIVRIERLYYELDINLVDGYSSFIAIFEELKDRRNFGGIELAALALDIFLKDRAIPTRLFQFVDTYYRGWVLVRRANYLNEALQWIERGLARLRLGHLDSPTAERRLFLEREVEQRIGEIYTLLGYTQRRLGNWREAVEYYEQARQLNEQQIDRLKTAVTPNHQLIQRSIGRLAETLNDIANIQRMRGDLDAARLYCKTSLIIRQGLGEQRKVGHCCYVMSMIMWELGNTSEAMKYLQVARKQYQLTKATVLERVWVDRYEGYILFRSGKLAEALHLIKIAIETGDSERLQEERAQAYLVLSRIYRARDTSDGCEEALTIAQDALTISTMEHNDYMTAESHLTIAFAIMGLLKFAQHPTQKHDLQLKLQNSLKTGRDIASKRHYDRLLILFNELVAENHFAEKNYLDAFEIYLGNWQAALKFKPSVFGRSLSRPLQLLHRLIKDDTDETLNICEMILERWGDEDNLDENYTGLKNEIQYIRSVAQAIIDRRKQELNFYQQFRHGSWQKALRICDNMEQAHVHEHSQVANVLHYRAEIYHSANLFSLSKIFCERALRIRHEYESFVGRKAIGDSYLLLTQIYWKLGMTSEASEVLNQADAAYRDVNSEVGLGLTHLERGQMAFRSYDFELAKESLQQAQAIFERIHEDTYLAQTLNVLGRLNRVAIRNPEYAKIRFREAERRGEDALKVLADRDWQVAAEIHLTLCILHYSWGRQLLKENNLKAANQHFDLSTQHNREGWRKIERLDTPVLISVYRGMQANLYLQRGDKERAHLHFLDELVYSTKTKHMRFIRALDLLEDMLIADSMQELAQDVAWFLEAWRSKGLAKSFPQVEQSLTWIADHRRFLPEEPTTFEPTVF